MLRVPCPIRTRLGCAILVLGTTAGVLVAPSLARIEPVASAASAYVTPSSVTIGAAKYGAASKFHVAVAVLDRTTGKYYAAGDYRGAFATESVVKVFIATRLLVEGAMHGATASRAYKMITQSDDAIASSLYGRVGGDSLIDWIKRHYHQSNLGSRPTHAGWWGNTHITALGLVQLYAKLAKDPHVSGWLLNAMHHAHRYGSDGTNQFFGLPSATTGAAVKQGWGCDLGSSCDEADFNSTGFVNGNRYAVAILARGPLSTYGSRIGSVLTGIAKRLLPEGTFPLAAPTVTSVSYTRYALGGGQQITLHGTNFRTVKDVFFGQKRARSVKVLSTQTLHAIVPSRSRAGAVTVRVMTSSGLSRPRASTDFHYLAKPTVQAVSITSGATKGGTSVTVSGANFTDVTSVSFGSARSAKVSTLSTRSLRATVPAHVPGGTKVVVRTRYGTSTEPVRYTYVAAPTVTAVATNSGSVAGGALVTLTGTNFTQIQRVTFGSAAASGVTVVSPSELRVQAPAHAAGPADVRVETSYGTSAITTNDRYTYQPAP